MEVVEEILPEDQEIGHEDVEFKNQDNDLKLVGDDTRKDFLDRRHEKSIQTKKLVPRGIPKSSRVWKDELGLNKRASSVIQVKSLHTSWKEKQEKRERAVRLKQKMKELESIQEKSLEEKRQRIKQLREQREANAMKNVEYQVIKNTGKLKKLSKKQWKNYRKLADINKW